MRGTGGAQSFSSLGVHGENGVRLTEPSCVPPGLGERQTGQVISVSGPAESMSKRSRNNEPVSAATTKVRATWNVW